MSERPWLAFCLGILAGITLLGVSYSIVSPAGDGHAEALQREERAYETGRVAQRCHEYCSGELEYLWLREPAIEDLAGVILSSSPGADEVVCACFVAQSVEVMKLGGPQ